VQVIKIDIARLFLWLQKKEKGGKVSFEDEERRYF
jgi:hypothetical protein